MPMFNFLGKCGPSGNSTGHTYLWGYSAHFTDTQILLTVSVLSPKNSHLAVEFLLLWDNSLDLALELVNLELETIDTLLPTHNSLNSTWCQWWHNVIDKPISELPLITATRAPGHNAPLIRFPILVQYTVSFFLQFILPTSFHLRTDPLHFQAGCRKRRLNLALVLLFIFCCSTFFDCGVRLSFLSMPNQETGLWKHLPTW